MRLYTRKSAHPTPWDRDLRLARRRADVEQQLITALLNNPRRGIAWCAAAGVTPEHFDQDDLRAAYIGIEHARWRSHAEMLGAVRFCLMHAGFWDGEAASESTGMFWSDRRLAHEAAHCPCPGLIGFLIVELLTHAETRRREAA